MKLAIIFTILIIGLSGSAHLVLSQTEQNKNKEWQVNSVTDKAGKFFNEGLLSLKDNKRWLAGEKFNKSVEEFLYSTLNVQNNQKLRECFNQLVETVYRIEFPSKTQQPQIRSLSAACGWNIDNQLADDIVKIVLANLVVPTNNNALTTSVADKASAWEAAERDFKLADYELDKVKAEYERIVKLLVEKLREKDKSLSEKGSEQKLLNLLNLDAAYNQTKEKYDKAQLKYNDAYEKLYKLTDIPKQTEMSGFNEQKFELSPLDELSKLELTQEEQQVEVTPKIRIVKAQNGDTVAMLAQRNGASPVEVAQFNGLLPNAKLAAGREIKIPVSAKQYQYIPYISPNKKVNLGAKPVQMKNGKVQAVIDFINEYFNDPYSVRFVRWSKVEEGIYRGTKYWSVQVKLRAKNAYGAYILLEEIFYIKNDKVVATQKL